MMEEEPFFFHDRHLLAFINGIDNATLHKSLESHKSVDLRHPQQNPDFRRHRRLSHQEEGRAMSVNRASFPSHDTLLAIIHFTRDYWFDGLPPLEALLLLAIVMLISVSFPSQVFTLLIGSMVVAQLLLVYWRKRHYRTYQQVQELLALCIFYYILVRISGICTIL
jgi:hypothetical protein